MKKIIFIFLGLLLATSAFGIENKDESSKQPEIQYLLNKGFYNNLEKITNLSLNLTSAEKYNILIENEKRPILPFLLNEFIGFGIGSYIDGDKKGGNLGLLFDSGTALLSIIGIGIGPNNSNGLSELFTIGSVLLAIGSKVYQGVRAFTFVENYNKDLIEALNLFNLQTSLEPIIDVKGNFGMTFSVKAEL